MNVQNRLRLDRIAARLAKRPAEARPEPSAEREAEADGAFLAAFAQVRDDVLRPVMGEVGLQLKQAGHSFDISPGGDEGSPSVDFHIVLPDRGDSKDTIRFFARKDSTRGWQVIAELELKRSPVELTRFETTDEITHDVAEQLIVDGVEQMFASTPGAPQGEATPEVAPFELPPSPPSPAPDAAALKVAGPGARAGMEADVRAPSVAALVARPGVDDGPPPPPVLPLLPDGPESRWARWAGAQEIGQTEEVDVAAFRDLPLPFVEGPPAPSFFAAVDAARPVQRECRSTAGNATMPLPVIHVPAAEDEHGPALTVEQYAAFCAELTVFPDKAGEIHRNYRVASVDARTTLDAAFAQRFRADPTLHQRWRALVNHYGAWYRGEARR